jgi:flagellar assembly protein FliH
MSSRVIPKEHLTAYQRWELAAVEEQPPLPDDSVDAGLEPTESGGFTVSLPTAEDLERIHQEAWREGYELGIKEGREAGFQEGLQSGKAQIKRLENMLAAMDVERLRQDEAIAQEVLQLALAVARQILRSAVTVKEGIVLDAIREAFASLPSLSGHLRVVVNPADAGDVRQWLASEHGHIPCKVQEDPGMEQGSFRFETDYSILHGELVVRWREVLSCLGADLEWLD